MTTKNNKNWFDIDRTGLSKLLERRGIEFAVFELIQNAWDEAGVTTVDVQLHDAKERGYSMLMVTDNAPDGFADLRHAYTLFAESAKKVNAEQRGRFNIGEKLVLSLCKWAMISTTKGTVTFSDNGRGSSRTKRNFGTCFQALIKMNAQQREHVATEIKKLIAPKGITTTFNDDVLPDWQWRLERTITCTLPTEIADAEGVLRRTSRKTSVDCYRVNDNQVAMIYEMGIPVVEHDCAFHVNVMQKVPLTLDRENVSTKFLRAMRTEVFNATHELLDTEDVNHEWTQTAIESGNAEPAAVKDYMSKRFGDLRASFDMSDPEANNAAVAHGYTIVHGSMLSKTAWSSVRDAEAITPAGQLFPTHPGQGVPFNQADETSDMKRVRFYAMALARELLDVDITVQFGDQPSREAACWGSRMLQFNVRNLGKRWFDLDHNRLAIDDLIIHEFGHHYAANHLSEAYNDALSGLAAKAMKLGREGRLP
jgi:Histidine kinase-, DNA gyrase B-, and HSP90-like ATPase